MNEHEFDILRTIMIEPFINQSMLSEKSGYSLSTVNKSIKELIKDGFLDDNISLTNKAKQEFMAKSPKNAIILAAGLGMRMVPINKQSPKALLEVNGESLIERIIRHLHEVGITEIYVVVGFMKEQFEYLIDDFGVELIVNEEYASKNNLHSLAIASEYISNTYIVPCDIWCDINPFHRYELYSWYMVSDIVDNESNVHVNRKMELVAVPDNQGGNAMVGISYIVGEQGIKIKERLKKFDCESKYDDSFWEDVLYEKNHMIVQAKVVHANNVVEINTYEQLRELDEDSNNLKSDAIVEIAKALNVYPSEIVEIKVLKKGMTNRSFLFTCRNKKYIMRIPGEGTDQLIDRRKESDVYHTIDGLQICDDIVHINPKNGYKITEFLEGSRVCNPDNIEDLKVCMKKLREFHELKLSVSHEFNIFEQINFYESLWDGVPSVYSDYEKTKENVLTLKKYIDEHIETKCLTHIDAVPDNFLFTKSGDIRLIDWEYAGMQDPHVDIAMFCIYSLYNKREVDRLINIYFDNNCPSEIRIKIYCYIATCGLLWSNWCEYKRNLGVEFGEYSLRQYRYAKDYYKIVIAELTGGDTNESE